MISTISIIIPHYNNSKALKRCLDSIFKQIFQDFEIIVVDDGSSENEKHALRELIETQNTIRKNPIKLILDKHKGASAARNRGAKNAVGQYLLFCDDDITMKSTLLGEMRNALENNKIAAFVYSSFQYGFKTFKSKPFDAKALKIVNYIHTTSLMRREWFPDFDESLTRFQDWDLWLQIAEHDGRGIWLPKILFKIKPRQGGISSWLPSFFYKIPWQKLGIKIKRLENYRRAEKIIKEKHNINDH